MNNGGPEPPATGISTVGRLVNVVLGIEDVELAGRCDQSLVADDGLELARLVIDDDDRRFLVLAVPDREPDFVAGLVVLGLDDAFRTFLDPRPVADRDQF